MSLEGYACATLQGWESHVKRIRTWLIHTIFGPAKSTAPSEGQLREDHPGRGE